MLRLQNDRFGWSERDTGVMTNIVGADAAVSCVAPVLPSILKIAEKKNVRMNRAARVMLEREEALRVTARDVKVLEDVQMNGALARTGLAHQRVALRFFQLMEDYGYHNFLVTDATGVGKTWEALMWARRKVTPHGRILVVTKNNAKEQWADTIQHYLGEQPIRIVEGTIAEQVQQAKTKTARWVIAHWESLARAGNGYLARSWDAVILDEAHYISNRKAQRSTTVFRLKSPHKMALTAHPYSNDPAELFSILRFLYPQQYKSYWRFFHMHVKATPKQWGGFDIEGPRRAKTLRWELEPFNIGRTKPQVFKSLPQLTRSALRIALTTRGEREYTRLKKELFAELDGLDGGTKVIPIINDLSRLTRVRQYLIDPALIGGREPSVKYPEVYELMDTAQVPVVVFTQFKQAALRLGAWLHKRDKKLRIAYIHGGMRKQVQGIKKRFLAGELDAVICVYAAASEALNLGKYGYLIHLDLPWTPRTLEQAEGRVDRMEEFTGKTVPTTATRIIIKNSYEERLEGKLSKKHRNFAKVFTVTDLRKLFA